MGSERLQRIISRLFRKPINSLNRIWWDYLDCKTRSRYRRAKVLDRVIYQTEPWLYLSKHKLMILGVVVVRDEISIPRLLHVTESIFFYATTDFGSVWLLQQIIWDAIYAKKRYELTLHSKRNCALNFLSRRVIILLKPLFHDRRTSFFFAPYFCGASST